MVTMEVSLRVIKGHLQRPNRVNLGIILRTLSGDSTEVRNGQVSKGKDRRNKQT